MFQSITLTNFLSFGPGPQPLELRSLNVIIGPNGSGKSNFTEALALLRAVPRNLPLPIRDGGGVEEWIWQHDASDRADSAKIEIIFEPGCITTNDGDSQIRYFIEFGSQGGSFVVIDERIEHERAKPGNAKPYFYFGYENGRPLYNNISGKKRRLQPADIDQTQSILAQRRAPEYLPEISNVGDRFKEILVYRSWSFGPENAIRKSCPVGKESHLLLEDFSNLPARLMALRRNPQTKARLLDLLKEVAPHFCDFEVIVEGGRLQLYLTEGSRNIPAHRLSDGTLRFLALVAIFLDPGDARLVVIEEPELGLHPDILPILRDLMVEASGRFQLIVTTHSTQLVDAMTDYPEAILICEKPETTTEITRLDPEEINQWRQFGSLGTLWMTGRLGGTRW